MIKVLLIIIAVLVVAGVFMFLIQEIRVKAAQKRAENQAKADAVKATEKDKIYAETRKERESINTGDNTADFISGLNILHDNSQIQRK